MAKTAPAFISFPPGSVSAGPVRVGLLANMREYLALNKPAGLNAFQEKRLGGGGNDLAGNIRSRAAAREGQFERLGISQIWPVHFPGREVSGVFLCAKTRGAKAFLRNEMGSARFSFEYRFLARDESGDREEAVCELPLAASRSEPIGYVSHKEGKKTTTQFRRLRRSGDYSLWAAVSSYDRLHQVRVHAAETGLRVLGESLYRPGFRPRGDGAAANDAEGSAIALHLFRVTFPAPRTAPRLSRACRERNCKQGDDLFVVPHSPLFPAGAGSESREEGICRDNFGFLNKTVVIEAPLPGWAGEFARSRRSGRV